MEPRPNRKTAPAKAAPYALAAYDMARDLGAVDEWQRNFRDLAEIMKKTELKEIPHDPRLDQKKTRKVMDAVMDKLEVSIDQRAFVYLLIEDKKLALLPWVYEGFLRERKRAENLPDVTITSAQKLTAEQVGNLRLTLKHYFKTAAEPKLRVDPKLIGGLKVQIGDTVYDQSVKGALERMKKHLDKPPQP